MLSILKFYSAIIQLCMVKLFNNQQQTRFRLDFQNNRMNQLLGGLSKVQVQPQKTPRNIQNNQNICIKPNKKANRTSHRNSFQREHMQQEKTQKQQILDLNVLRYQQFETLKLNPKDGRYIQVDQDFINDVKAIAAIKQDIFSSLMQYRKTNKQITCQQCDQIDFKARLHYESNLVNTNSSKGYYQIDPCLRCDCGCQRGKGNQFSICSNEQSMHFLGPGIVLHFMYIKLIFLLLVIVSLIYGVFAFITNFIGTNAETQMCSGSYCIFQRMSSNENKWNPQVSLVIQEGLGLVICIIWLISIRLIKYLGALKNQQIDNGLTSASDNAVKISNLPTGSYSQLQLIEYLNKLHNKIQDQGIEKIEQNSETTKMEENNFNIKSIQIIYNMEFSRKMLDDVFKHSTNVYQLLEEDEKGHRNLVSNSYNYKTSKNKLKQSYELLQDLRKKFLNDHDFRRRISSTSCIIEFHKPNDKDLLLKHFGRKKIGIIKEIQEKIKSWVSSKQKSALFKGKILRMERAPEPSDIIWLNCQKNYSLFRIAAIYGITFLIVSTGFGIYSALDYGQQNLAQEQQEDSTMLVILSLAMAITLQIINKIIWFSMFYLLELEYNHTLTDKIVSQMNKTLFSTTVNNILLPFVSSYVIRNKIYQSDGLNGQAFTFQIIFLVVAVVTALDPISLIKRVVFWIRRVRNGVIRWYCAKLSKIQSEKGVGQINTLYEGSYFDIAENYVNLMGAIYHALFFCQLQPSILALVILMSGVFYWGNKYRLLRTCKIPQLTDYLIFENAISQANVVPIMYAIGTLSLTYIQHLQNPNVPNNYAYASAILCISILFIGNPGDIFNKMAKIIVKKCSLLSAQANEEQPSAVQLLKFPNKDKVIQDSGQYQKPEVKRRRSRKKSQIDAAKCNDTYYQNSNSLTLLGFQAVLRGKNVKAIMGELKAYCESYFKDQNNIIQAKNALIAIFNGSNSTNIPIRLKANDKQAADDQLSQQSETKSKIIQVHNFKLPPLQFSKKELCVVQDLMIAKKEISKQKVGQD